MTRRGSRPPSRHEHPSDGRILRRAKAMRAVFDEIWPMVTAVVGTVSLIVLLAVPSLRDPQIFAGIGGFITITTGLAARKGRREE